MYQQILVGVKDEFAKAMDFFSREVLKLRTGQATPALVEDILVEAYGQSMPLQQVASISCPERRQILIQPWDATLLLPIEKALSKVSLGSSPLVEKQAIRISLPPLTNEFRQMLGKMLAEKAEQVKQVLRKERDHGWDEVQKQTKEGTIREDDKFRAREELQKLIDEYSKKIDSLVEIKKKEIEI